MQDEYTDDGRNNEYLMDDRKQEKWQDKGFVVWLLLIFMPIVGIPFMWIKKKSYGLVKKIILTVIFVQWILFGIGFIPSFAISFTESFMTAYEEAAGSATQIEVIAEEDVEEVESGVTFGEKNALRYATNAVEGWYHSKITLMEDMEYAGYTDTEIAYAMENLVVDWMEEAVYLAEYDVEVYFMSKAGVEDDLVYFDFTEEEIACAMESLADVDWMEQAVLYAKDAMEYGSYSKAGLQEQMEWAGFTSAEIAYGVAAAGY